MQLLLFVVLVNTDMFYILEYMQPQLLRVLSDFCLHDLMISSLNSFTRPLFWYVT